MFSISFLYKRFIKRLVTVTIAFSIVIVTFCVYPNATDSEVNQDTLNIMANDVFTRQFENNKFSVEYEKTIHEIKYIRNDGSIASKKLALYRPIHVLDTEKMPLIFIAFYRLEDVRVYVNLALKAGFAIASIDDELTQQYFNELPTDTLVFNNAALYYLKNLKGIDNQRIVVMGNSCGGYTALMLNALHLGIMYTVAISPITDLRFNIEYFDRCMTVFDIKKLMPNCYDVCNKLIDINKLFDSYYDLRWYLLSPIYLANCFSSHTIVVHGTGDMLVPVGQVSKKYEKKNFDNSMPITFNPFYIYGALDEIILSYDRITDYYEDVVPLKYDDVMLHICIYEDGLIKKENSHNSPENINVIDYEKFFDSIKKVNPKDCIILTEEKAFLLIKKYIGDCEQIKAHTGIDDSIYGSLAIYQNEVVDELQIYIDDNSFDRLDNIMRKAIKTYATVDKIDTYLSTWDVVSKVRLKK